MGYVTLTTRILGWFVIRKPNIWKATPGLKILVLSHPLGD